MPDLALVTGGKIEVVESIQQTSVPAAETLATGNAARFDTSNGKATNANGTTTAEARAWGINVTNQNPTANNAVTLLRRGVVDGFDLTALAYDAPVYLSDTDGKLSTAPGTVSVLVGRVIPGTATKTGTAYDKLLSIEF